MRDKSDAELTKLITDTRLALREERFAASGARAKDPSQAAKLHKVVARVLTEQRVRVMAASQS